MEGNSSQKSSSYRHNRPRRRTGHPADVDRRDWANCRGQEDDGSWNERSSNHHNNHKRAKRRRGSSVGQQQQRQRQRSQPRSKSPPSSSNHRYSCNTSENGNNNYDERHRGRRRSSRRTIDRKRSRSPYHQRQQQQQQRRCRNPSQIQSHRSQSVEEDSSRTRSRHERAATAASSNQSQRCAGDSSGNGNGNECNYSRPGKKCVSSKQDHQPRGYHRPRSPEHRSSAADDDSSYRRTRSRHRLRPRPNNKHRRNARSSSVSPSSSSNSGSSSRQLPLAIRAGVVSEDEHHQNQQQQQQHAPFREYPPQDLTPPPPGKEKERTSDESSSRDDTIGHFQGPIGTVIANRYRVTNDVGLGTFGRVVECLDLKKGRSQDRARRRSRSSRETTMQRYVAIKVVRNVKRYYDSALIEADILEDVNRRGGRGITHCAMLFDAFSHGKHFCLVFESLGPSLYDFLKRHNYQPFPMVCVRSFARQLLEALEFLHSFRLIHTDLKPENILLTCYREKTYKWRGRSYQIPESSQIKVIDFGGATYNDEKKSSVVNTRQYRAPEVILGVGWSTPSDLWSAGCILAELCRGELLFATHDNLEHLALMERGIGPFSRRMLKRAKQGKPEFSSLANQAFDSSGRHRMERALSAESCSHAQRMMPLESVLHEQVQQPDGRAILDLLRRLLVIDPDERAPASEVLLQCRI